ncbi:B3/B4 domain-containing protein [Bauldia litoralis]|uniref:B3/B4 domain-containing protein (DNA/RNA-binding domain of Phe-tRNA-synthetase) n=1 Tax=Bauldia litoralis TaxID=665467 RepID=A0A1G6D354_9HYPH|nr:phenylalanine--tRNA ligase beta subunit-related protein [Bauldia litoralis]SDB39375.1 B3/B4 domain-containing protein (DNA/RNA-binding domain of Phe-tRNA-synthetase) [Bauldia litoralis]
MNIDISDIIADFPDFRVAVMIADGLEIGGDRPDALEAIIAEREAAAREAWAGRELSEIPGVAAWRRAYRAFGIKKTSYRSSVERLVKNVQAGRGLPRINPFVDAYNAVSLTHVMPLGADDLARVSGDLAFRYSRPGDEFLDMASGAGDAPQSDPPKPGEVVYADDEKILCRRWNWRQDLRSLVTALTDRAVVTVQSNGEGDLDAAVADLGDLVGRFAGGTVRVTIADRRQPLVSLR